MNLQDNSRKPYRSDVFRDYLRYMAEDVNEKIDIISGMDLRNDCTVEELSVFHGNRTFRMILFDLGRCCLERRIVKGNEKAAALISVCAIHLLFSKGMKFIEKVPSNDRDRGGYLSRYD